VTILREKQNKMLKQAIPAKCDVLVIGSGGAALTFALTAKDLKPDLAVQIVEKTESVGGCTAYSGGGVWLPGHGMLEDPSGDSERARKYLKNVYPEIDEACLDGFITDAPRLLDLLVSKGVQMEKSLAYPDYYQEIRGASTGRAVFSAVYKGPKKFRSLIRKTPLYFVPFTINEAMTWGIHRIGHWDKTLLAKRKLAGPPTCGAAGASIDVGSLYGGRSWPLYGLQNRRVVDSKRGNYGSCREWEEGNGSHSHACLWRLFTSPGTNETDRSDSACSERCPGGM